jgi:hypothetical protein
MAMATKAPAKAADKPQAKRATMRGHGFGQATAFVYFGREADPKPGKTVTGETKGSDWVLTGTDGSQVARFAPATKVWAGALADGTWGEVAGTQPLPDQQAEESKAAKPAAPVTNEALGKQGDQGAAPKYCGCGCGMSVTRKYRPGHDARHSGELRRAYEAGTITREQALAAVAHSPLLVSKLSRALQLAEARMAARAKSTETEGASK